jgi:hypothetical protein
MWAVEVSSLVGGEVVAILDVDVDVEVAAVARAEAAADELDGLEEVPQAANPRHWSRRSSRTIFTRR